jgi:hypothetical protein
MYSHQMANESRSAVISLTVQYLKKEAKTFGIKFELIMCATAMMFNIVIVLML